MPHRGLTSFKEESEFIDAEEGSYFNKQQQLYSHQGLVMEAMRKCLEAGNHEMRSGWFNEKIDKMGNIIRTYIEDTRQKFIESVKIAEVYIACDFDIKAKERIKKLKDSLKKKRNELLLQQWEWYINLTLLYKQQAIGKYGDVYPNAFNPQLIFFNEYIEYELMIHRLILKELNNLAKRLGFYETKIREE